MFIQLPLGWLQHPFPTGSFRITSVEQIDLLRELGLVTLHYLPARSSLHEEELQSSGEVADGGDALSCGQSSLAESGHDAAAGNGAASLPAFEVKYQLASAAYEQVTIQVVRQPARARQAAEGLVNACIDELAEAECHVICLLSGSHVEGSAAHAVNVLVLALLLGRALGMHGSVLQELGLAALLHDVGKITMPMHIAEPGAPLSAVELQRYRAHVGESVALGQQMGLSSDVLISIAQHHEAADGSGHPLELMGDEIGRSGQILALVNTYERLCNPLFGNQPLTPHEAVSELYARQNNRFDPGILTTFIRMMGVYPPGCLIQLLDGRYGLVVKVDPAHPLKPVVRIHATDMPGAGIDTIELLHSPGLGIRRSLRPVQVPFDVLAQLQPGSRTHYYFERAAAKSERDANP